MYDSDLYMKHIGLRNSIFVLLSMTAIGNLLIAINKILDNLKQEQE